MSVTKEMSKDGKRVLIKITGRFDYKLSQEFRDTYREAPVQDKVEYFVDLSAASYMDSSALGMLLLLREHAKSRGGSVTIERPGEQVDNILKIANFEQLFRINYEMPLDINETPAAGDGVGA